MLAEAGLIDLLDEALLLTTELSTNGVLHAGTDIDLEVVAGDGGLTVTVTDFSDKLPIPVKVNGGTEVPERGRGLLLVDHFAASWGTTHRRSGKEVWFRLNREARAGQGTVDGVPGHLEARNGVPAGGLVGNTPSAHGPAASSPSATRTLRTPGDGRGPGDQVIPGTGPGRAEPAAGGPPAAAFITGRSASIAGVPVRGRSDPAGVRPETNLPSAEDLAMLARVPLRDLEAGSAEQLAGILLSRLCAAVGAVGGLLRLDQADGRGLLPIAEWGLPVGDGREQVRVRLPVSWPWRGELSLATLGTPGPYLAPLAELCAERLGLVLENDRLRRTDLRRQAWLTFLAEASELLAQSLDFELTMALIPRLIVPRLGQWCAVYGTDEWGDPQYAAAAHSDESALPMLVAGLSAAGRDGPVARLREAIHGGVPTPLPAPVEGFAVPLTARGQRLGALAVGRYPDRRQDPEEIAILDDVARRAALALDNSRIHAERRRVAQTLQQSLLPPALPKVPGIAFGAEYVPTLGDADVGGDFYDVVPMPDDRWLLVIGDVSGKGVQAASVTGLVRDVIRVLVRDGRPLSEMLSRINETLVERGGGRYCTLAMAAVRRAPRDRLDVVLHLAGHERPVLIQADGRASFVGTPGTALGLLETISMPDHPVSLEPGDTLVFYTDGVTERRRGAELFGLERLREASSPLAGYAADVVAARLRAATLAYSAEPPRDDIAILALGNDAMPRPQ